MKAAHPIEEVVGARVEGLKRAGSIYKACCPFHAEKTPSFTVDPTRGSWRCFGACSEGGDVLEFLVKFEGSTFWEALTELAKNAGIELPQRGSNAGGDAKKFAPLYEVLERAERLFAGKLRSDEGERARAYLEGRGLRDETLRAFGVGFAPGGNALLNAARRSDAPLEPLVTAGLVRRGDDDRPYDFFRGRIAIPIRDIEGRTVGFGARLLPGTDGPKYVNTPETPVFHKGRIVYGLDRALSAARRERHLCLVEGYTDVMAAHQVGCSQVAAVLGTATTLDHARLVRRSGARRVSLFFDGDAAGRKAVHKALRGLLGLDGVTLDVVRLPEGDDPCDLLVREQRAGFDRLLSGAEGWFDFLLSGIQKVDPSDTNELVAAVDELVDTVVCVQHPVGRDALIARAASALGLDVGALREQSARAQRRVQRSSGAPAPRAGQALERGGATRSAAAGGGFQRQGLGSSGTRSGAPGPDPGATDSSWRPGQAADSGRLNAERSGSSAPRERTGRNLQGNQATAADVQRLRLGRAWRHFAGALLSDNGLISAHRDALLAALGRAPARGDKAAPSENSHSQGDEEFQVDVSQLPICPDPRVTLVLQRLLDLYDRDPDPDLILDGAALELDFQSGKSPAEQGESAVEAGFPLELEKLARLAESPRDCAEQALIRLGEFGLVDRLRGAKRTAVMESGLEHDPSSWSEADHCQLLERYQAELDLQPRQAGAPRTASADSPWAQAPEGSPAAESGAPGILGPKVRTQPGPSTLSSVDDPDEGWDNPEEAAKASSHWNPGSVPASSESAPDPDDFFHDGADSLTFDLLS